MDGFGERKFSITEIYGAGLEIKLTCFLPQGGTAAGVLPAHIYTCPSKDQAFLHFFFAFKNNQADFFGADVKNRPLQTKNKSKRNRQSHISFLKQTNKQTKTHKQKNHMKLKLQINQKYLERIQYRYLPGPRKSG